MNRTTIDYYVAGLPVESAQCRRVREGLTDEAPDDSARLQSVLVVLDGEAALEPDTVPWLTRAIRGHYGGEGYALEVSSDEEAAFWSELHRRYPTDARLCLTAADALFTSTRGELAETLRLFITAFELDPERVYAVGGEVSEALQESEWAPEYWTAIGRTVLMREGPAVLAEWLAELREEMGASDPDGLRRIEQALENETA